MTPPPYDNPSPFEVANWTDEKALRRYTQRRNDLEIMLRRFQWYVVGNSAHEYPLADEEISEIARLVFTEGVKMKHLDNGSTSDTSSPLLDILTSKSALAEWKGKDLTNMFHAYAVQCEGAHELANASRTSSGQREYYSQGIIRKEVRRAEHLIRDGEEISTMIDVCRPRSQGDVNSWRAMVRERRAALAEVPGILEELHQKDDLFVFFNGRFRISISAFFTHDFEEHITFPFNIEPEGSACYWLALDGPELESKLHQLLPLAKRLDSCAPQKNPDMQIAPAIAWALDHVQSSCTDIQIVNRIRKLTHVTTDAWLRYEKKSLLASKGQFVITFVGAQFCTFRSLPGPTSGYGAIGNIVQDMQRSLRLLDHYCECPASEPQELKDAGQEVEDLRNLKRQLIARNEELRKENAELERENKRLRTTKTEKE
jgi:hypothetical protein